MKSWTLRDGAWFVTPGYDITNPNNEPTPGEIFGLRIAAKIASAAGAYPVERLINEECNRRGYPGWGQ